MKKARFLASRRPAWGALEDLLERAETRHVARLDGREIAQFSRLYRAVCYDLATVRSRDWGSGIEGYLNDLVRRGHRCLYRSPPGRPREIVRFFTAGFPRLLRRNIVYFWVALVLFLGPGIGAAIVVGGEPERAARVLPDSMMVMFEKMYAEPMDTDGARAAAAAGFYIHNNIGIAFRCFAMGVLLGLGTVFLLVHNGIFIGAVAGYVAGTGHGERFFSFVISHGSFELTAIVISGAAGLILGHAIVHPGEWSRLESLRRRGLVAVKLAFGAGGMLAVAAFIEGFWSPSGVPVALKFVVGGLLWLLVAAYLGLAGREGTP